ncbi:unnamed protein product, partial [Ectocarpus fasciculatus]
RKVPRRKRNRLGLSRPDEGGRRRKKRASNSRTTMKCIPQHEAYCASENALAKLLHVLPC